MTVASLETKVENFDVNKLKTAPARLIKLVNVVDNVARKIVCDKLVTKVNAIDTKIPSNSG